MPPASGVDLIALAAQLAAAIGPWVGLIGGSGGLIAVWLALRRNKREDYQQFFDLLRQERDIYLAQFDRSLGQAKEQARVLLDAKDREIVAQSEAYRKNLELRVRGPQQPLLTLPLIARNAAAEASPNFAGYLGPPDQVLLKLLHDTEGISPALLQAEDYFIRGNLLLEAGDIADAIAAYKRSLDIASDVPAVLANLALALAQIGEFSESLGYAQHASALLPADPILKNNVITALNGLERFDEAIEVASAALELDPKNPFLRVHRAETYRALHKFDKAIEDLDVAAEGLPGHPLLLHSRAATLRDRGDLADALTWFDMAVAASPSNPHFLSDRSRVHSRLGHAEEARRDADAALRLDPDEVEFKRTSAEAYLDVKQYAKALPILRELVRARPDDLRARHGLADALIYQELWKEALENQEAIVRLDPTNGVSAFNLAQALTNLNRNDEALKYAAERADHVENPASLYGWLAWAYAVRDDLPNARHYQEAAVAAELPANELTRVGALIAQKERDFDKARELLSMLPADAHRRYAEACLEAVAGEVDAALGHLGAAIDLDGSIRGQARTDTDLDVLRSGERAHDFNALIGLNQRTRGAQASRRRPRTRR